MAKTGKINKNEEKIGTVQHRNRCSICSRPRGFMRFFLAFVVFASGHLQGKVVFQVFVSLLGSFSS